MKYLKSKTDSVEESILQMWEKAAKRTEDNTNDKSDDGEGLDKVQPKAVKKKFMNRKDKDIDNDGDVDASDKYLHKRRKTVSKAIAKEARQMMVYRVSSSKLQGNVHAKDEKEAEKIFRSKGAKGKITITLKGPVSKMPKAKSMKLNSFEPVAEEARQLKLKRQLKDPKKEMMVALKGKVKVIDKSEWPEYKKKGYNQAEEVEENLDVGTPENTKSKLEATPGQSVDAWEEQLETIQKKNSSMRERLAQIWDMDEGKNPFEKENKKEEKSSKKTMTGEPVTKVEVDPKISNK